MENEDKKERKSLQKIFGGTLVGYLYILLTLLSGLLFTPWIIRVVGSSGHAIYTLSNSLISLFLLDLGLSTTVTAFISNYRAKGDEEGERNFLSLAYKIYLALDVVMLLVFIGLYFLTPYIYPGLNAEEISSLKNVFLISGSVSVLLFPSQIFNGITSAHEEFVLLKLYDFLNKLFYIIFTSLALLLDFGLYGLVIGNATASILTVIVKFLIVKFKIKSKANWHFKPPKGFLKSVFSFTLWSAVNAISIRLIWAIGPSVLGVVSSSSDISAFGVVTTLENFFFTFSIVMSNMFMPKMARLNIEGEEKQIEADDFAIKISKFQNILIFLAMIGIFVAGGDFLSLWLKGDNEASSYAYSLIHLEISLIIIPLVIDTSQITYKNQMFVKGYMKEIALISLFKGILNVGLMFLLGHFYGNLGAIISITIVSVLQVIANNVVYKKKLHANIGKFFLKSYLPFLIPILLSIGVGLLLHFLLPLETLYVLIIETIAMMIVYLPSTYFLSYKKEERKEFFALFARNKKEKEG